jgi:hypothetical protein
MFFLKKGKADPGDVPAQAGLQARDRCAMKRPIVLAEGSIVSVVDPVFFMEVAMQYRRYTCCRLLFGAFALLLHSSMGLSPDAQAATFTVDRTDDVASATACVDDAMPSAGENCTDGIDNDGDGLVDTNDPGCDCSLRGAIIKANTTPGADTINVPAGTYTLTIPGAGENAAGTGDLDITDDLTIIGEGPAITIIQACTVDQKTAPCPTGEGINDDRVFHVDPASGGIIVNISEVTVQNGGPDQVPFVLGNGGGILLGGHAGFSAGTGTLTLTDTVVRNNFSFNPGNVAVGGGIYNNGGTLHVINSTFSGNLSNNDGGGIANNGSLTVSNSTISNNIIHGQGGGIQSYGGVVSIDRSTIDGNGKPSDSNSGGCGGGMRVDHGELTVTNSTISGNRAGDSGGGLCIALSNANIPRATVTIRSSTITGNTTLLPFAGAGGGGIISDGDPTLMSNTIVAGNTAANNIGHDCRGAFTSAGYNLIGDAIPALGTPPWCTLTAAPGDQVGSASPINPQLAPLADNGGPTRTHALCTDAEQPHTSCAGTSPAIDMGNPAEPGSTADGCPATDQRGINRFRDRCDIGAYEADKTAGGFTTDGVGPNHAGNAGPVCALVYGSGFANGATVKLARAGESEIVGAPVAVLEGGKVISTAFNLTGRTPGRWNVVVANPDGGSATLPEGFTIEQGGAPELWHDVLGPTALRPGRPGRFRFLVGNRGNVDALGVPVMIAVPREVEIKLLFPVARPPALPGQPPIDWTNFPIAMTSEMTSDGLPDETIVPWLVPVIPAGSTAIFEFLVTAPGTLDGQSVQVYPGVSLPHGFTQDGSDTDQNPDANPDIVDDLVTGAESYARRVLNFGGTLDGEAARQYLGEQLGKIIETGAAEWVHKGGGSTSDGVPPSVYCLTCPVPDTACWLTENCRGSGTIPEIPALGGSASCDEIGWDDCGPPCAIKKGRRPGRPCQCPPDDTPVRRAFDPNEKVGSHQAGSEFVAGEEPLRYAVHFENDPILATAPAQEVVVTDQLDVAALDLDSLSLGPISFGDTRVVPTPGLSEFTRDVDLRPTQDLLVRINARLDKTTGLLTWRFTSLDPATMEPPADPLAGFLPPNVNPPEGDGAVVFTVKYKSGLATGVRICNRANIVFDQNDPILTPEWCNTLDSTKPVSQVVLPSTGTQTSTSFPVQWSGADEGAGIQMYSIFVSENNGPFVPFVSFTPDTSATFTGQPGSRYAFYSVAWDKALNMEDPPAAPDVATTIDLCPDDPKIAPGVCGCGLPDTDSDGDGTLDCNDGCPNDSNKTAPGVCGCGTEDIDSDSDDTANCNDACSDDPNKTAPGACGCGVADTDGDGDGTADCSDQCPADSQKTAPGACGCGVPDTDSDGDGTVNCNDGCSNDPNKTAPGICGCGVADTDSDEDGAANCNDACPDDPENDVDGDEVCGNVDNCPHDSNPDQVDTDGDGTGDVCEAGGFQFSGFFPPVNNPPVINTVKAGSAVPLKFSLNGNQGLNIFAIGYPQSQVITCDSRSPLGGIEKTVTAGSSSLSYDASTDQYVYVWKTKKAWAGRCRQVVIKFINGSSHVAHFKFT